MRRITKLSLLLAPLVLASVSGCATPRWMSQSDQTDPRVARVNRLLSVAATYEEEGNPEAAMGVYEHVIAQEPDNKVARQRRQLLAQQGVKSRGRSFHRENPYGSSPSPLEMMASAKKPAQKPQGGQLESDVIRQNTELAKRLARQETQPQVAVPANSEETDSKLMPTPAFDLPAVASQDSAFESKETPKVVESSLDDQDEWVTAGTSSSGWKSTESFEEDLTSTSTSLAPSEFESTTVATADVNETTTVSAKTIPVDETSDWTTVVSPKPSIELASLSPTEKVETDSPWQTTDLTRPLVEESAKAPLDENWESTKLARLCEDLSSDLIPIVDRLDSREPAERIAALQTLGDLGPEAKSASVAVFALLEDPDATVSVYAAGTLRQITGDAWSSVRTLSQHLNHDDERVAQLAAYLLGQMGPEAMDAVPALEELRDSDAGVTSLHAAEALTHITPDDATSIETLQTALKTGDRQVRWFAAISLGTVAGPGERQAVEALKSALHDEEPEVRIAACLSLGGLGSQAEIAIPELEEAAQSETLEVKTAAKTALACLRI